MPRKFPDNEDMVERMANADYENGLESWLDAMWSEVPPVTPPIRPNLAADIAESQATDDED